MAEMSVNLEDVHVEDIYQDVQRLHRGDVVWVEDDGYPWNANDISGQFALVKVPGVPKQVLWDLFMMPEEGDPKTDKTLQRRASKFDIDTHLEQGGKQEIDLAEVTAQKVTKPKVKDPSVLPADGVGK